jgi:hypothetical protein
MYHSVTVSAEGKISRSARDLIVELTSEEAQKVVPSLYFTLHDAYESACAVELIVEGGRDAVYNLVEMLAENLPYHVSGTPLSL